MRVMRDSGVEWIGEIPEGWETLAVKHLYRFDSGDNVTTEAIADEGEYPVYGANGLRGYYDRYNVQGPHILIGRQGALAGNVHTTDERIWATDHALVSTQVSDSVIDYYAYALDSANLNQYAFDKAAQPGLAASFIENLGIMRPPLDEQRRIADYLDARCADIDAVSQKVSSEIDLLGEYRKSVIYEAVTKGLDKDAPMQDSGIEWVGEIPEGWVVVPNRTLWSLSDRVVTNDTSVTPNDLLSVSSYYGVDFRKNHLDSDETLMRAPTLVGYRICQPNDLVINIMLAWNGSCGVSRDRGIVSPSYAVFSPNKQTDICPRYYHYLYRTPSCARMFEMHSTGIIKSRLRLYPDVFLHLHSLLPPIDEQCRIADNLDARCADIDAVIARKRRQLDVLADYRKSLIYEYVTGKREVA